MAPRKQRHGSETSRSAASPPEAIAAEAENENPAAVAFSGDPHHDPAAEVGGAPGDRAALPPSSTLRPGNEEAAAVGEAFLDLEATPPRPERSLAEDQDDDDEADIVFEEDEHGETGDREREPPVSPRVRPLE